MSLKKLFLIASQINLLKWRFSYGRQPYKRIFSRTNIFLPIKNDDGSIDEDHIEKVVSNCYGWNIVEKQITDTSREPAQQPTTKTYSQEQITSFTK
jgi:hypothetical protein